MVKKELARQMVPHVSGRLCALMYALMLLVLEHMLVFVCDCGSAVFSRTIQVLSKHVLINHRFVVCSFSGRVADEF